MVTDFIPRTPPLCSSEQSVHTGAGCRAVTGPNNIRQWLHFLHIRASVFSPKQALPQIENAFVGWESLGNHLEERAGVCEKLGDIHSKLGFGSNLGMEYLERALSLFEALEDPRKQATIHSQIGRQLGIHLLVGSLNADAPRAESHLHRARAILEGMPEGLQLGLAYCGLATIQMLMLNWRQADGWIAKALALGERLNNDALKIQASLIQVFGRYDLPGFASAPDGLEEARRRAADRRLMVLADTSRSAAVDVFFIRKDPRVGLEWAGRPQEVDTIQGIFLLALTAVGLHAYAGELAAGLRLLEQVEARVPSP